MKVIIAGGRDIFRVAAWIDIQVRDSGFVVTEVLSGAANGIDAAGMGWAKRLNIPVTKYPARWFQYGRSAGPRRNAAMARDADALIAVWDGKSRGTENMIDLMEKAGKPVYVVRTDR